MKKLLVLAFASILSTNNSNAMDASTNAVAYTLAETVYTVALGVASTEATGLSTSSKIQKAEAIRIQNEAQNYYQTGVATVYLENKIKLAKDLDSKLSDDESVDLLVEASKIILSK